MPGTDRVGLVLAGGGARGAYEAGAVSVLSPALERRGERPTVFVGTSVGAINAAYMASVRHLPAEEAVAGGIERWCEVNKGRVIRPILARQVPLSVLQYAGEILSLPGVRLPSLLDPKPLEDNLKSWIDWAALHRNVRKGTVDSAAAVATAASTGRTVVFVEAGRKFTPHRSHVIDYVQTKLYDEHVRASAAIPILFPPIRVDRPIEARGWYFDGGTRLNTPLKPALDLGADRVIVIGTDAVTDPPKEPGRHESEPPDFGDGALHVLQGMLVDPLAEDMRMLGNINMFFADSNSKHARQGAAAVGRAATAAARSKDGAGRKAETARRKGATAGRRDETAGSLAAKRYREARGKPPYRQVPYIFVAPRRRGAIGELAVEVFRSRYGGWKGLRSPDFRLLNRLLGGDSPTHGELLSYLFFDPEFIQELIAMGRADARRWLHSPPGPDQPWQVEPLEAFTRSEEAPATSPR
jgi:NTE family protein